MTDEEKRVILAVCAQLDRLKNKVEKNDAIPYDAILILDFAEQILGALGRPNND